MAKSISAGSIASIAQDTGASNTDFVTDDPTLTLAGSATVAGNGNAATLGIWISGGSFGTGNGGKGTLVGTVSLSGSGSWTFDLTTSGVVSARSLADGTYTIRISDGSSSGATVRATQVLIEDTTAPQSPTIALVADAVAPVTGTVQNGGVTNDVTPTLSGTAEANSSVTIFDATTLLGTVTANGSGAWNFTTGALGQGSHSFTAKATDAAGNISSASGVYTIAVDATAPSAPTITAVADDVGPVTGTVQNGEVTDDLTPTLSGTAEARAVSR